jgi:hypothetical protein
MLVIFKISVILNVITLELFNSETVFTVLFPWDLTPGILVYCATVYREPRASIFKAEKVLKNVSNMFLSKVFVPMYQSTRRHIPNDCVVNIKGKVNPRTGTFGAEGE